MVDRTKCCDSAWYVASAQIASGATVFVRVCSTCNKREHGKFVRTGDAMRLGVAKDLGWLRPPETCEVCGAAGTEVHHLAPTALFGEYESDLWPTVNVCVTCHIAWHRAMTPGLPPANRPVAPLSKETIARLLTARRQVGSQRACRFCATTDQSKLRPHSWAPRGDTAGQWPSDLLCVRCQSRWLAHFPHPTTTRCA